MSKVRPSKTHRCKYCAELGLTTAPRPIAWTSPGGKVKLCKTHERARKAAEKLRNATARVARVYGIGRAIQSALWEYQGQRCGGCGRKVTRTVPDTDHDHKLARLHDHPVDEACEDCLRGLLCRYCNKFILGMGYTADMLDGLAVYLRDPPFQKMRRGQNALNGRDN